MAMSSTRATSAWLVKPMLLRKVAAATYTGSVPPWVAAVVVVFVGGLGRGAGEGGKGEECQADGWSRARGASGRASMQRGGQYSTAHPPVLSIGVDLPALLLLAAAATALRWVCGAAAGAGAAKAAAPLAARTAAVFAAAAR